LDAIRILLPPMQEGCFRDVLSRGIRWGEEKEEKGKSGMERRFPTTSRCACHSRKGGPRDGEREEEAPPPTQMLPGKSSGQLLLREGERRRRLGWLGEEKKGGVKNKRSLPRGSPKGIELRLQTKVVEKGEGEGGPGKKKGMEEKKILAGKRHLPVDHHEQQGILHQSPLLA